MYIALTGSENNKDVYIYHSFRKENGKSSSRIYKKLGKRLSSTSFLPFSVLSSYSSHTPTISTSGMVSSTIPRSPYPRPPSPTQPTFIFSMTVYLSDNPYFTPRREGTGGRDVLHIYDNTSRRFCRGLFIKKRKNPKRREFNPPTCQLFRDDTCRYCSR